MRLLTILALAAALLAAPAAAANNEPPILAAQIKPAQPMAAPGGAFTVSLVLTIAPKLHINGPAAHEAGLIPTKISFSAPPQISFGQPAYPPAHKVRVQFADQPVEVYSGKVGIEVPGRVAAGARPGRYEVKAKISYQACDDQVCHLPASLEVNFSLEVAPGP
jgi:DsbC/DsbD-like thiol-disulfide interchange protein